MEDFWRPVIQDEYSALRQPTIEANNFELKPTLITMVQRFIACRVFINKIYNLIPHTSVA